MNSSLKDSTKRNHLSTLMLLQEFKKNITFSDLTFELISSFEYFLQLKGYHTNTIAKHMKHLKRHVNIAINKEYIEIQKYAFRKYKINNLQSVIKYLFRIKVSIDIVLVVSDNVTILLKCYL